ncbi:MAG: HipA domain-containing protein [Roseburia sp.]|nr:HipA domain-containing protein [Anaeroplasma bactoclasticum]MCM1197182.1 HipA domain-containing protein [Roseburia sp.]MCM1556347.1 HipA domain-containing protein [Anaeroplasma bactoclasticum]
MIDFSNYEKTQTYYGGSERKIGIMIGDSEYMIKFQKYTNFGSKVFNHISEYLGSHIFELLGFKVQETYLGIYNGEEVVACKNFNVDNFQFVPFNAVGESSLDNDKEKYQYTYEDIMKMLSDNSKLTNVNETIKTFWEMFVVDALIGNFDRHGSNWGFLKKNNKYTIAPIFDNGSCLFPQMIDETIMEEIMKSDEETNKRIYEFPTSQIKLKGKKSSYYDVINSLSFKECNDAVVKICSLYTQDKIDELIESTDFITEKHKEFYKYMIKKRYDKILKQAYLSLMEKKYE